MHYLMKSAHKRGRETDTTKEGMYSVKTGKAGIQNCLFDIQVLTIRLCRILISFL